MKRMKRMKRWLLLFAILVFAVIGCGNGGGSNPVGPSDTPNQDEIYRKLIVGSWQREWTYDPDFTVTYHADGSFQWKRTQKYFGGSGTYKIENGLLKTWSASEVSPSQVGYNEYRIISLTENKMVLYPVVQSDGTMGEGIYRRV